jgi:hypothetical protein
VARHYGWRAGSGLFLVDIFVSVSFDGLKIVVGVLMGSDKSVSHKIFVSL